MFAPVRVFARLRTGICIATGSFGPLSARFCARLRTGVYIAAGSFGLLSVRFCARFCANMRTREQGRTSFVRVFASLPGRKDRTAASAAAYSYLLVATDARSTSRDRLRAMPCQKEENERSEVKSTKTIRMSLFAGTTSGPR